MAAAGEVIGQEDRRASEARRVRLAPIGFWSCTREDDLHSEGKLNDLRALLIEELQRLYGSDPITLYDDPATAPDDDAFEARVRAEIDQSTFFVAILSPGFLRSEWCNREIELFAAHEAKLVETHPGHSSRTRILPIHYVDIGDARPADPRAMARLRGLHWLDFRELRDQETDSDEVRKAISGLAAQIRDLLHLEAEEPTAPPAEPDEQTCVLPETDVHAARQFEEEARRRRELALRKAEESRLAAEAAAIAARRLANEAAEVSRVRAAEAEEAERRLAAEQARVDAIAASAGSASEARVLHDAVKATAPAGAAIHRPLPTAPPPAAITAAPPVSLPLQGPGRDRYVAPAIGLAALALAIYLLWPSAVIPVANSSEPARRNEPAAPVRAQPRPAANPTAWLEGRWGLDGDCGDPLIIARIPAQGASGQLRVDYDGARTDQRILSETPDLVVTDVARYARQGRTVLVSEAGEVSRMDYRLTACPAR